MWGLSTYREEDSHEVDDERLQAKGDENDGGEGGALEQAREEIVLVVDAARADLVEDLRGEEGVRVFII